MVWHDLGLNSGLLDHWRTLYSLCLTLSNIRYISRVKRSNPEKGVVPSPTPQCSSYWKRSLLVALDYSRQLTIFQELIVLYDGEIYVEKDILGNLDINSKLGFSISGVVNSPWPFLGLIKRHLVAAINFLLFLFYFIFLRRKSKTTLAEGINI